jgi:hypothetical protein
VEDRDSLLPQAHTFGGRVFDAASGQPLGGAVTTLAAKTSEVRATTDALGAFVLQAGSTEGRLTVRAEGYLPETVMASAGRPITVKLNRTTLLQVRMVHTNGTPAPQARLEISPPSPGARYTANGAGQVTLSRLKAGAYRLSASSQDSALAAAAEVALAEQAHLSVTLTLAPSAAVQGQVTEADGSPAPGAAVWAQAEDGTPLGSGVAETSGTFVLRGLAFAEQARIHAVRNGRHGASERIALPRGASLSGVMVQLPKGEAAIAGVVLDADAVPLAGVSVDLAPAYEGGDTVWARVATEETGRFRFDDLAEGLYDLTAQQGELTAVLDHVRSGQEAVILQLAGGGEITGRVADELGQPVIEFHLRAEFLRDTVQKSDVGFVRRAFAQEVNVSDTEGRFRVNAPRRGHYVVEARTQDGRVGRAKADGHGRAPIDVGVIVLKPGAVIAGRVVDRKGGGPVSGVSVSRSDRGGGAAVSAEDGRFSLRAPKGKAQLAFDHPGYYPRHVTTDEADPERGALDVGDVSLVPGTRREIEARRGFGGVGAVLKQDGPRVVFDQLIADGPAMRAGIRRADVLVSVDGEDVSHSVAEAISVIRGEAGTLAWIKISRGNEEIVIPVRREPIHPERN